MNDETHVSVNAEMCGRSRSLRLAEPPAPTNRLTSVADRQCDRDPRPLTSGVDVARGLADYAAGYADGRADEAACD